MNKHECLGYSETATGDEMKKCYEAKAHMYVDYQGRWYLKRPDDTRVFAECT